MPDLGPPAHQKALQAAMEAAWGRLDSFDAKSEQAMRRRVSELRLQVLDQIAALPTLIGPDGKPTFQSWALEHYRRDLQSMLDQWTTKTQAEVAADLVTVAQSSDADHAESMSRLTLGMADQPPAMTMSVLGLSDDQVRAATVYTAAQIQGVGTQVATLVNEQIQAVVFGGQSRWEAIRAIRSALGTDKSDLGRLTTSAVRIERTALMSVFNIVAEQSYREAAKSLPGLQSEWIVAGSRVCPRCLPLAGARKKPGGTFPGGVVAPPLHFNCRCRTVAYLPAWG